MVWKLHYWQLSETVVNYVVSIVRGLRPLQKNLWANDTVISEKLQVWLLLQYDLILCHNSAHVLILPCVSMYISEHRMWAINMGWLNWEDLSVITDELPKKKWERNTSTIDKIWVQTTLSILKGKNNGQGGNSRQYKKARHQNNLMLYLRS